MLERKDHPFDVPGSGSSPGPSARELNNAWLDLHRVNLEAFEAGQAAAGRVGVRVRYQPGTDAHYWFNEGYHGREFLPLTTTSDLTRRASVRE